MICHSGLVQNRSKPVKKKPSCSSGQGSRPGELSSSPPLKMPASDGMLGELKSPSFRSNKSTCITIYIIVLSCQNTFYTHQINNISYNNIMRTNFMITYFIFIYFLSRDKGVWLSGIYVGDSGM